MYEVAPYMIQDGIIPTPVPQRMNDMSNERIIGRDFPITIAGCGVTSVFYIDICFVELYGFGAGDIWDFHVIPFQSHLGLRWICYGKKNCWGGCGGRLATHRFPMYDKARWRFYGFLV